MKVLSQILPASGSASTLTDGKLEVAYADCPGIFDGIDSQMIELGVDDQDCLAFHCEYTLANALLWLYLIERGYSFLVIAVNKCAQADDLPRFCRYAIEADWNGGKMLDGATEFKPIQALGIHCQANPRWQGYRSDVASPKIIFRTSGTTGRPKLAAHFRDHLLKNARHCLERLGLSSSDRLCIPVPIYHMFGLGAAFLPGVLAGASIDLQANSNLLRFLQREKEFEPNIAFLTPPFMTTLVKGRRGSRSYDLTVVAGDILREDTFRSYEEKHGSVVQLYGSTEMGAISCSIADTVSEIRALSVGWPMHNVECRLEDETRQVSELLCKHDSGFGGYINDAGEIDSRDPDGWYATHDLARIGRDGMLQIIGRNDHCVNRSGVLVSLREIEYLIEALDQVESAVAVTAGENSKGKGIVVFCQVPGGSQASAEEIRKSCFRILPGHSVPDRVQVIDVMPLLASGKLDRLALARMAEQVEQQTA